MHASKATIRWLLLQGSLLEGFNSHFRNDKEVACCCVIVWSRNPNEFALERVKCLEELQNRPRVAWHFADPVEANGRRPRAGPIIVLSYEVLLHVDQVTDYRPPMTKSEDWPERNSFHWRLGVCDDWWRPSPRCLVQERLGPRKRDCSSSGDGRGGTSEGDNGRLEGGVQLCPGSNWFMCRHGSSMGPCQQW
jgi:hypothetical protein